MNDTGGFEVKVRTNITKFMYVYMRIASFG